MSKLPSVCIMIPTYNQAKFIVKAVESALGQDYQNLEIIISDDASTDNTEDVVKPFLQYTNIKYKKNTTNIGRVANYNHCLYNNVLADWVINLDGDDYYTNPTFISEAIKCIQEIGEREVLFYQGVHIRKFPNKEEIHILNRKDDKAILNAIDYFFDVNWHMSFSHMSTIYNRALAVESGFYELDIISSDIFSTLKLCLNNPGKKVIISKIISGKWVQHILNASKTPNFFSHLKNSRAYKKLYLIAIKKGLDIKKCIKWLKRNRYLYFRYYFGLLFRKITQQ
jgi:glycosyltransferase involved in cell wall biosynthesis